MRLRPLILVIGTLALSAPRLWGQAELILSEFMAANSRTLADEDRDYPDWIEIHNPGPADINLLDWHLTDSTNESAKWTFPATNIVAGGYLVVFASGKDRRTAGAPLHTSFNLAADGEYLALVRPEGEVEWEYVPGFPRQFADVSYGWRDGRPYYFPTPTPGAANTGGYNDFVADTKFSVDRGFFTQGFDLEITTATPGATIYYTTNGVAPSAATLTAPGVFTYQGPIRIGGTTVVRAAAFREGYQPSNVDSQTYLFLDDVIRQSPTGAPPPGWPASWGSNVRDYGMDPDIVNHPTYGPQLKDALQGLPSFAITIDLKDLFDSTRGIYANPGNQGRNWERKCSTELIYPDGRKGFQIDCGIRIRGGYSRSTDNPKHAFRLFFREQYGRAKLKYPLFDGYGAETFDAIDLRTFQNYSWSFAGDSRGIFVRDQTSRDLQLAMGHQAERGEFYHLYINGQYWGLYNTCERPEASYAETYYGGSKADYDVIKVEAGPYTIFATDGNMQAWTRLYTAARAGLGSDAAFEQVQGNNPDGTRNPDYEQLVDLDNLIDYLLVAIWGGNLDAPVSWFLGNSSPNNWYGIRSRTGSSGGFKFFIHDAEHTLLNVSEDRVGPFTAGDSGVSKSNPQFVWQKMWSNPEFRIRMADRVHRHFFNGGVFTPETVSALFQRRTQQIERAVIAESARWGDSKRPSSPLTQADWRNEVNRVVRDFFPQRAAVVLTQLRSRQLYPAIDAPTLSQHGGTFQPGFALTLSAPAGTVYYTLDGTDPRLRGGAVSASARRYAGGVTLTESVPVKARAQVGTEWSALTEAQFTAAQTFTNLLITELMYHPASVAGEDGDQFEFIELKNANPFAVDVGGVYFTNGVQFAFPLGARLDPGQFAVLVKDTAAFAQRYPGTRVDGVYAGNLANAGETVTLCHAVGTPLFSVRYADTPPWPVAADGGGFSLVSRDPNAKPDPDDAARWRASSRVGGSPGADDPPVDLVPVVINEILTHTDPPQVDAIELYNPGPTPADVGGWYLTDDRTDPKKFRLPTGTVIPAGGYRVWDERDFNPTPGTGSSFTLSSHGEEVFLFSADTAGNLTGYADGFAFGAAANGVTFGRYVNSVGEVQYPAQRENSLGGANVGPRVGPVVINEIQYQPAPGSTEFIELKNLMAQPVPFYDPLVPTNRWRINGVGFEFPPGAAIPSAGLAVVTAGDPEVFRSRYGIPLRVPVFGPFSGVLQNSGERIELQRPDSPDLETNALGEIRTVVPYIAVDAVRYNDKSPWPTNAAGLGPSLERINPAVYGDDPANWRALYDEPSPGLENDGNRPPRVDAGADQELTASVFPASFNLSAIARDDGQPVPGRPLTVRWRQVSGPGPVVFTDAAVADTAVLVPGAGAYLVRAEFSDGELTAGDEVLLNVVRPSGPQTLVSAGSEWSYRDDGANLGTTWREINYADTAWSRGRAKLGYGDNDEVTRLSYGPNGNDKYITYYFRRELQVTDVPSITTLTFRVRRDDGVVVYLNGVEAMRDNMPDGDITFSTRANAAVGGSDETTFFERAGDPGLLREGRNVLAVEVHQSGPTSSDLGFDLALEAMAFPANLPPTVNAGPDLAVTLPETARLQGSFGDDGLPNPPGAPVFQWTKLDGPGDVVFSDADSWVTTAAFGQSGDYRLRLTVDDGSAIVADEVRVRVTGLPAPAPVIASVAIVDQPGPEVRVTFEARPGTRYVAEYRDSLSEGNWQPLFEVAPEAAARVVTVADPLDRERTTRFYRIRRD